MTMIAELFGDEVFLLGLPIVKEKINALPRVQAERYSFLLHEWSKITGVSLSKEDFDDVGGIRQEPYKPKT